MLQILKSQKKKPRPGGGIVTPPVGDMEYAYTVPSGGRSVSLIIRKNGKLVRNAINGELKSAGPYIYKWDGLDNDGVQVASGAYDVNLFLHDIEDEWEGVGFNSSMKAGVEKTKIRKGLDVTNDMCFTSTHVYTARGYGEGSSPINKASLSNIHEVTQLLTPTFSGPPHVEKDCTDGTTVYFTAYDPYQNDEVGNEKNVSNIASGGIITVDSTSRIAVGGRIKFTSVTGGSTLIGGVAPLNNEFDVTEIIDSTHFRISGAVSGTSFTSAKIIHSAYCFIFGVNVSDDKKKVFSSGVEPVLKFGNRSLYSAILPIKSFLNVKVEGLACQDSGNYLFASVPVLNKIYVLNKNTGDEVRNITFTNPGHLAMNGENLLLARINGELKEYTIAGDGNLTVTAKTFEDVSDPVCFDVSPAGTIGGIDNDTQQRFFLNNDGTFIRTPDVAGGYSVNAQAAYNKLATKSLRGNYKVFFKWGLDGSYWVGDGGNNRVLHCNGTTDAVIEEIFYRPRTYSSCNVINAKGREIFGYHEYEVGFAGGIQDNCILKANWGYWLESENLQQYVGIKSPVFTNGRTYALVSNDGSDSNLQQVELVAGGVIRFTGQDYSNEGKLYEDGSFRYMTYDSGRQQFNRRNVTAYTGNNLIQGPEITYQDLPILPVRNGGTFYNPGEITTSGVTILHESSKRQGFHLRGVDENGNEVFKTYKSTPTNRTGDFASDGFYELGNRTSESPAGGPGDLAFVVGNLIFCHMYAEFLGGGGGQAHKWNMFNDKGAFLKQIGVASFPTSPNKPLDGMAGNAFSSYGYEHEGDIYLYNNDEGSFGGVHRWKLTGLDTLTETTGTITVPSTTGIPNYRTGLTTTNHVSAIKSRIESKTKFAVKSDVKTNSPGILDTLTLMANQLVNNPLIDRYTGPTGTGQITVGALPEPGNKGSRVWAAAFLGKMNNNQTYINAAKTAILDFLAQPINNFPDYDAAWPNGTRWRPNTLSDLNPLFIISQYFKKYVEAFDLIRSSFNSTQDSDLIECFEKFALFTAKETNGDLDPIWTNRDVEGNKHAEGYIFSGDYTGTQRKMFDGDGTPKASLVSLYLNNRRADKLLTCLQVGILTNNDYLISSAYVFVKEWLKYGCYPYQGNVYPGEMERGSESGFRDKGFSYSVVMGALILEMAHLIEIYKKNPITNVEYPSLKNYTTTDGAYGSQGGPKGIYAVNKTVLKMCNGELNITYNGEAMDGIRTGWEFTEDTTLGAGMYLMYKDEWFKKSALREHPGSRPFPSGGNGSGAYRPYEGVGGGQWWLLTRLFDNNELTLY